jgi:hypothetical protein
MLRSSNLFVLSSCALLAVSTPALAQESYVISMNAGALPNTQALGGTSGGPIDAHSLDSHCHGYIGEAPNHVLDARTTFNLLRIFVRPASPARGDLTLMFRGPTGVFCDDDTDDINPRLDLLNLPAGRYELFIGSYARDQQIPYQLTFSELASAAPIRAVRDARRITPAALPRFGQIVFNGPVRAARRLQGRTGGEVDATVIHGAGSCRGYLSSQPSYLLNLTSDHPFLRIFVTSAKDTTMVVRRPDDTFVCSDDAYNTPHPSVEGPFPAGVYQVWVGGYSPGSERPFQLTVTSNAYQHPVHTPSVSEAGPAERRSAQRNRRTASAQQVSARTSTIRQGVR